MLLQRETNKLISQRHWENYDKESMFYILKHSSYKYATEYGDTIQYYFCDNNLSGIAIDIAGATIEDVVKYYDNLPGAKRGWQTHYVVGNDYVIVGKRQDDDKSYVLILNNSDNEIDEMSELWVKDGNVYKDMPSADVFYAQFLLGETGKLTGNIVANAMMIGRSMDRFHNKKYYEKLITPYAEVMAAYELKKMMNSFNYK